MSPWGPGGHFWGPPSKGRGDRGDAYYPYYNRSGKRRPGGSGGSYFLEHSNEEGDRPDPDRNGYGYPSFYSNYGSGYMSPRGRPYTPRSTRGENRTVIVSNISEDTTQSELEEAFSRFSISSVKVITKRNGQDTKPHAFINFDKPSDARSACMQVAGKNIRGRQIKVNLKTAKPGGGSYRPG